jgi:hypothetical protein
LSQNHIAERALSRERSLAGIDASVGEFTLLHGAMELNLLSEISLEVA